MKKNVSFHNMNFKLGIVFLGLAIFNNKVCAYDPNPLQDLCVATGGDPMKMVYVNGNICKDPKNIVVNDFYYSGFDVPTDTNNVWGYNGSVVIDVTTVPGLNTQGVSIARNTYAPKGLNPPHTHPRASEIIFVEEGTLYVGFVSSNIDGNRLFSKTLRKGDIFVFPKGLIHFQINVGHTRAIAIVSWGSQNSGYVLLPNSLFGSNPRIPTNVLTKSFQLRENVIEYLLNQPWPYNVG